MVLAMRNWALFLVRFRIIAETLEDKGSPDMSGLDVWQPV